MTDILLKAEVEDDRFMKDTSLCVDMSVTEFGEHSSNTFPDSNYVYERSRQHEPSRNSSVVLRVREASCQLTSTTEKSCHGGLDGHTEINCSPNLAIMSGSSRGIHHGSRACTPLVVISDNHSFVTDSEHSKRQTVEITHASKATSGVPGPSSLSIPQTREVHGIQQSQELRGTSAAKAEDSSLDGQPRESSGSSSKSVIYFVMFLCLVSVCSNISLMLFASKHQLDLQLKMFVRVQSASDIVIVITNVCILLWIIWERYHKDRANRHQLN